MAVVAWWEQLADGLVDRGKVLRVYPASVGVPLGADPSRLLVDPVRVPALYVFGGGHQARQRGHHWCVSDEVEHGVLHGDGGGQTADQGSVVEVGVEWAPVGVADPDRVGQFPVLNLWRQGGADLNVREEPRGAPCREAASPKGGPRRLASPPGW